MPRTGIIVETDGSKARVQTARRGICGGCEHEADCCGPSRPGDEIVETVNDLGAKSGQRVEFELPGHREIHLALLVWVLPLVGLLVGAILGQSMAPVSNGDVVALAAGGTGFAAGLVPAFLVEKSSRRRSCLPVIERVLPGQCPQPEDDS